MCKKERNDETLMERMKTDRRLSWNGEKGK